MEQTVDMYSKMYFFVVIYHSRNSEEFHSVAALWWQSETTGDFSGFIDAEILNIFGYTFYIFYILSTLWSYKVDTIFIMPSELQKHL